MIKKIYLTLFTLLFLIGCGSDNSYDGENLHEVNPTSSVMQTLYDEVVLKDINEDYKISLELVEVMRALASTQDTTKLRNAREKFIELLDAHKKVSSFFVASKIESQAANSLLLLEFWHVGKNLDIPAELDTIFSSTTAIESTLYKNSNKSITALEYTLFGAREAESTMAAKMTPRRAQAALIMANSIVGNIKDIQTFYKSNTQFTSSEEDALSMSINILVDSSYKLREWRLGDAAGLTQSYLDDANATRLEYYQSSNSLEAIKIILNKHKEIMDIAIYPLATKYNTQTTADAINANLKDALSICSGFSGKLEDNITSTNALKLYNEVKTLQYNYTALINSLNFTQDIIEADGD